MSDDVIFNGLVAEYQRQWSRADRWGNGIALYGGLLLVWSVAFSVMGYVTFGQALSLLSPCVGLFCCWKAIAIRNYASAIHARAVELAREERDYQVAMARFRILLAATGTTVSV